MTWDPARKLFIHIGRGWVPDRENILNDLVSKGKRLIAVFESANMERWRYQGLAMDLDEDDGSGMLYQHWTMQPFNYGDQYLGVLNIATIRGPGRIGRLELVSSRDGRIWRYVSRHQAFIPLGASGHYDASNSICLVAGPSVPVGDQIYIYFTSRNDMGYLGMSKLTRDRFVGMQGGDGVQILGKAEPGIKSQTVEPVLNGIRLPYILTRNLRVTSPRLQVNLQTQADGFMRVSVRRPYVDDKDWGSQEIPGYSGDDCIVVKGDDTRADVRWKNGKDLSEFVGRPVVLMFELKNATLWAYRFSQ